ncbi:uncharacterized protein K452DRAFT_239028 [Aplosporella prunicola CBS 121167]|uniref:Uncharacterized protein n=1 Tax=Aplosporella prunicola CBS 121167 TaxID=1176127 RepID=A0A6A6AWR5_9PEZI|nr:uncharacterized protein K452DRAFT_239028 [Aplosporella prunicola CBS 121167]KAF2135623.1 hypothetical protein K452DRAFT_239028 [Aplosporella prunicola CBS 121167]
MPRAAKDATMFTATGPHAHSKATQVPLAKAAAPSGETPQQKIARLRAAAQQAKVGQESTFDKVISRGRVWADRAHRVTALSLIAATGIAGVVTVFALGDMMIYNRRKRKEWFHEQNQKHAIALAEARQAVAGGAATEDQILLLNRERAAEEHELAKKNKPGIFGRAKESLFGGLSKEEKQGGTLAASAATDVEDAAKGAWDTIRENSQQAKDEGLGILQAVEDKRREGEHAVAQQSGVAGGPLDHLAEEATAAASQKSKSWTSWITGR